VHPDGASGRAATLSTKSEIQTDAGALPETVRDHRAAQQEVTGRW